MALLLADRFWLKVDKDGPVHPRLGTPCWLWTGAFTHGGYGSIYVKKPKKTHAHRVSFFLEHGRWPNPCALHECDVRLCVNPAHLYEGTRTDNARDREERGRGRPGHVPGEMHGRAKLTDANVEEARRRYAAGERLRAIATSMGVGQSTIYRAVHGETKFRSAVLAVPTTAVGEMTRGERNGAACLTDEQARMVYVRYRSGGVSYSKLAREFGVSTGTIRNIATRKSWKHITEGLDAR